MRTQRAFKGEDLSKVKQKRNDRRSLRNSPNVVLEALHILEGDDEKPVWMKWIKTSINGKDLITVIYQPV